MSNIHLSILGSITFLNILNELDFKNVLISNKQLNHTDKKIFIKILFPENLKINEVKKYLLQNEPTILILSNKEYIKKNNLRFLSKFYHLKRF
jgi:hypothetical protein